LSPHVELELCAPLSGNRREEAIAKLTQTEARLLTSAARNFGLAAEELQNNEYQECSTQSATEQ